MAIKALVIDDSGVMRKMVIRALTESKLAEFEFVEAQDGVEGLEMLKAHEIDLALIDWNMPNMSGIDFVREVRRIERMEDLERVPMVMVTSEKTMAKVQEALDEAGADQFISKPFTVEDMQRKLKAAIDRAKYLQVKRARNQMAAAAPVAAASKSSGFLGKLFG